MTKYTDEQVNQISRLKVDYVNNIISGEELINSVLAVAKDYPNPRSNIIADAKRFGRYMKGHGEYGHALPANWARGLLDVTNNDLLVIKALKEQQQLYKNKNKRGKVNETLDAVIENAEEAIRIQSIGTMNIPAQQNMSVPVNYNLQLEQKNVQVIQVIIDNIENIPADISTTELETLIKVRIGQSIFRQQLLDYWNNSCSVTECGMPNVLIASHIKPWRDCNGAGEKLDVMNGLLLIPNLDALFDKGFISFDNNGKIIISSQLSENDQERLDVNEDMELRETPNEQRQIYLEYHRERIFEQWIKTR
jgi:excinuclease UvrABC ATPase subunit